MQIFYFIRPTVENLAAYERWSGTELQNHSWLGDMVDEVLKVELQEGNTMIIPTGWIHAVVSVPSFDSNSDRRGNFLSVHACRHSCFWGQFSALLQCCDTYAFKTCAREPHTNTVFSELRVRNIEIATQVPKKFRFPMFSKCEMNSKNYQENKKLTNR